MPLVALAGALSADSVRADCPRPRGAGSLCTVFEKPVERGQHQEWHQGYRPAPGAGTTYHGRFPTNGAYRHNGVSHRPAHHRAEEPPRWTHPAAPGRSRLADASAWHWLLLVPVALALLTPLYNRVEPTLFGFPFFYWFQLGLAGMCSLVIGIVYLATRKRS
ncbi:MAG: hypothetical protein AUG44_12855 [Actinobacteria bacterium 13_1_20CM_3_71_11]|nr:MAG: hypothetical protein AUG44_12855 [Actinobacteria bacterium 13_1_20CM_3_71_11]